MKIRRNIVLLIYIHLISFILSGQTDLNFDQVPIQNYAHNNLKSGNQNWSIAQDINGIMYFGNNNGLLIFNGNQWHLHPLANHTAVRSVEIAKSGRVYVGSFEEFGYFQKNQFGKFHYTSISDLLMNYEFHNEEIWKIILIDDVVYFQSFTVIFKYRKNTIEVLYPYGFINSFSKINHQLILNIQDKGLFELKNSTFIKISDDVFFKEKKIPFILPFDENNWLIASEQDGIMLFNQKKGLRKWTTKLRDIFQNNQINRGLITKDGRIIIGTILNGVYVLKKDGSLYQHINKNNGLQNNTVLALLADINDDIWVGLDRGIDLLNLNSDITFYHDYKGEMGSVYSININNNKLFVGTNQGLYFSKINQTNNAPLSLNFQLINNSQGQVWNLFNSGNQLLIGHNQGTFEIKNDHFIQLSHISGGFSFELYKHEGKEYLIGSTYTKLVVYEKQNKHWHYSNTIEGFMHPIKQIKVDYLGNIWASHFVKGLFRINLNDKFNKIKQVKYYGQHNGFKNDYQINVTRFQNRVVFINDGDLYTYNDIQDTIIQYPVLKETLGGKIKIRSIIQTDTKFTWIIAERGILLISFANNQWQLNKMYPFDTFYDKVISGQEFVLPIDSTNALVALDNGLAHIKYNNTPNNNFKVVPILNNVYSKGQREIPRIVKQDKNDEQPIISFQNNSLVFEYCYPLFRRTSHFLVKLQGLDKNWIKTKAPVYKYDRLPPGDYSFLLKAVDSRGVSSDILKWSFSIKPPWFWNITAKIIYVAILLALFAYIRNYYKRRLRFQARKMKIDKERELIKVRNEKLEAEIKHKSKELANTTFLISKKNESLLELRKMLSISKQQQQTGSFPKIKQVIRLIDRNISNEDDWKVFENNFERAHDEFLKRIREQFPDLTPNDLKLCAYLRMNLSSKKIALLRGISIRAVENHRYRLRKKIGLQHDANLIEYMMNF